MSFIIRERNLPQLKAAVERGVTNFLSVGQFAATYGQSQASIAQLTGYLAKFGISTQVYADNVDVVATGTAGQFDQALVGPAEAVPRARRCRGTGLPRSRPRPCTARPSRRCCPNGIARNVLAILGLTNYGPFSSQAVHVNKSVAKPQAGSSNSCVALTGLPNACNLPSDFAADYGLNPLYKKGATGSGRTLAIVTLAALDPGAPQYFWKHIANVPSHQPLGERGQH